MDSDVKAAIVYWANKIGKGNIATDFFSMYPDILDQVKIRESQLLATVLNKTQTRQQVAKPLALLQKLKLELQ